MKSIILIALTLTLTLTVSQTFANCTDKSESQTECTEQTSCEEKSILCQMGKNIVRGYVNLLTSWIEIPRCFWLETVQNPYIFGPAWGLVEGSLFCVGRTTLGVFDVVMFGLTGEGDVFYTPVFPEYIFDSKWKNEKALVKKQMDKE